MARIGVGLFVAGALLVSGLNLYWIVRGFATGAVPTLHKLSDATILRATDPGAFLLNLGLRALIAILLGGWAAALLCDELKGGHRS